jgi:4-hydroxy-3-polyprenylbenzoate decarboxylase
MDAMTKPKRKPATKATAKPAAAAPARSYPDLHDHLRALDKAGLLVTVDRPINKDTEMHPLVRWQFRGGIEERDRKAFLFTNVVDSKKRKYDIPVAVGVLASNREIYRIGIGCKLDEIDARWVNAARNPIPPRLVENAPCHEIVIQGKALNKPGNGLDGIPLPISTPGWDVAPYATLSQYITKDPDTGIQNMGNYRGQVKAPRRLGMNPSLELRPGIYNHWEKLRARGFKKLPCAVMLGAPPCITFASVQKLPESVDELDVAGGLVGSPINVVKAKTVDLLVPAEAEIVIEGFIDTEYLEPEAPFGESHGHVNLQEFNAFMDVTCITRRRDAVLTSIISQVTPSESSLIKRVAYEPAFLHHLQHHLNISGVTRVFMHEPLTNLRKLIVIQMKSETLEAEVWRALYGASSYSSAVGKLTIAVNEDIEPENLDMVMWAMSYRMRPHQDLRILDHKDMGHGPRTGADDNHYEATDSAMLINAMLKRPFPPISLPGKQFMEGAKLIWEELGLPALKPEAPWYGYSLGQWPEEFQVEAERATRSEYWTTGEIAKQRRRNDKRLNDPYLSL